MIPSLYQNTWNSGIAVINCSRVLLSTYPKPCTPHLSYHESGAWLSTVIYTIYCSFWKSPRNCNIFGAGRFYSQAPFQRPFGPLPHHVGFVGLTKLYYNCVSILIQLYEHIPVLNTSLLILIYPY